MHCAPAAQALWCRACYRRVPAKRRSSEMAEGGSGAANRVDTGMLAGPLDRDSPADIEFARNWVPQDLQVMHQLSCPTVV